MNSERLSRMLTDAVSIDSEFHKFQPGLLAPPLVCASVARVVDGKIVGQLVDRQTAIDVLLSLLRDQRTTIVNVNIAIDMLVIAVDAARTRGLDLLPYIFDAYASGRVYDPALAEALHHIGLGCLGHDPRTGREFSDQGYSLELVHELVTGKSNAKVNDLWRTSYALLADVPIDQWRTVAGDASVDYPIDDAKNPLEDALAQAGLIPNVGRHDFEGDTCKRCGSRLLAGLNPVCTAITQRLNLHDLANQTYTAFCMLLGAAWGLRPDPIAVATLKYRVTKDLATDVKPFVAAGIIRENGSCCEAVLKRLQAQAYGATASCTECGKESIQKGRKGAKYDVKLPPGKVIGAKGNPVNCKECDGTGLQLGSAVPRSPSGEVSIKRDYLNESGDEFLMSFAAFGKLDKIRETYLPWMEKVIRENCRLRGDELTEEGLAACIARIQRAQANGEVIVKSITLSPNVLLEANRCSYRDKSQVLPRKGGVRDCFVPDDGFGYYSCDYTGIEMASWAQICLWMLRKSDLAHALNNGVNAHSALGALMCGMSYEDFTRAYKAGDQRIKDFRQAGKTGNFSFMGGAGEITVAARARGDGEDTEHPTGPMVFNGKHYYRGTRFCLLIGGAERCGIKMLRVDKRGNDIPAICSRCVECCKWIRETWFKKWPEAKEYFARCTEIGKRGFQVHPTSKRLRGGIGFTDGANGFFQELAACGAKAALRSVVREQYDSTYIPPDLGERSILFNNSRNIVLPHDELFGVGRLEVLPEVAERVCVVMKREMIVHIPDVRVEVEPTIMDHWYKEAAMVRDASGRLMIWQPKEK